MDVWMPEDLPTYDLMIMTDAFRLITDLLLGQVADQIIVLAKPYAYLVALQRTTNGGR